MNSLTIYFCILIWKKIFLFLKDCLELHGEYYICFIKAMWKGEMDDILVDFDNVIMQKDPRRYPNDSFDLGFEGVLYYINTRLRFAYEYQLKKPFDAVYLSDIQYALKHQIYSEMEYNQDKIFCQCMEYGMGNPDFELGYLQLPFVKCIMA